MGCLFNIVLIDFISAKFAFVANSSRIYGRCVFCLTKVKSNLEASEVLNFIIITIISHNSSNWTGQRGQSCKEVTQCRLNQRLEITHKEHRDFIKAYLFSQDRQTEFSWLKLSISLCNLLVSVVNSLILLLQKMRHMGHHRKT